jgi:hypothetical protein
MTAPEEKRTVLPLKFATLADDYAQLPKTEAHDYSSALPVDSTAGKMNKPVAENAHISEKVYYFPESYNALRRELDENWPQLWALVGYAMAFDSVRFIELMDDALDERTTFDSDKVGAICHKYLNALRKKRGVSIIPWSDNQ